MGITVIFNLNPTPFLSVLIPYSILTISNTILVGLAKFFFFVKFEPEDDKIKHHIQEHLDHRKISNWVGFGLLGVEDIQALT